MTYEQKIDKLVSDIDEIIIETLKQYDTRDLEEIIKGLIVNHIFTSKDSIQGLIYELEKLKDIYANSDK
jgi:hypothetical protein